MTPKLRTFDIIVVGGGHAGIEAALASARLNKTVGLVVLNPLWIGNMPCNPSIGGPAKGIVTREIDALGGEQAKAADATMLQVKLLNTSKGPGVWALRTQNDKIAYKKYMQQVIAEQPNITVIASECKNLIIEDGAVVGIKTTYEAITAKAVILTTGTYLASSTIVGSTRRNEGPDQQANSQFLSEQLKQLGFELLRLKTGTPPRIHKDSIDYARTEEDKGSINNLTFQYQQQMRLKQDQQLSCYLIHTTKQIHDLISNNFDKSPMYSGEIKGTGPRYCPSIEDKIKRFANRERHQIFIEPESLELDSMYLGGFSTSMPIEIQDQMIRLLPGLENAKVMKYAYAIEYDAINPIQLFASLETKLIKNLFTAGQINGTSGYEEAACQGLIAGINAVKKLNNQDSLILKRSESYIGVLIDDLVTKGIIDPYRLLTSRAEYRLHLRNDNAEIRLINKGYEIGLISQQKFDLYNQTETKVRAVIEKLKSTHLSTKSELGIKFGLITGISLYQLLKRPEINLSEIYDIKNLSNFEIMRIEIEVKYDGYIQLQNEEIEKQKRNIDIVFASDFDYKKIRNLSSEAVEKLIKVRPNSLQQAKRISGISPSDIAQIILHFKYYESKR